MRAAERKAGVVLMIESCRGPSGLHMARGTFGRCESAIELSGVDIFVTPGATLRRRSERDLAQAGLPAHGTVAIDAGQCAVHTFEDELSSGVIEGPELTPGA